jgi:hypothetical protein
MTPHQAKRIIAVELNRRNVAYTKLTAKTVPIYAVFDVCVEIHGLQTSPTIVESLSALATANGFRLFAENS